LATGSSTAYYDLNNTAGTWINGSDIVYMAVIENDNGGGIIFSYTPYILRHEYTKLHGEDNAYNGSKLPDNISNWLVNGFPEDEDEDSPGFEAILVLLVLVPLAIPVLRRRR
ncbi:MAG: Heimdall-CTERM domain-containing surface protein, partial [Candidatus Hodarchaeales archaeon]